MTPGSLAQNLAHTLALPARVDFDVLGEQLLRVNRVLRPYDGWLASGLLTLNLMVVVWSVESAGWVPTPNLAFVLLLAALCGFVISRLPIWGIIALPLGLAAGLLVVVWQLVSFQHEEVALTNWAELLERLSLWVEAARNGDINIDPIPFAFVLVVLTWMVGLLGAWMFVRHRHFWGVFILGGAGLFSNLTYLPPNTNVLLWIYLFTALVLVARVQSVRRRRRWEERNLAYDGHLGVLSLADSSMVAGLVLLLAFFAIPKGGQWGPTNSVYEGLRAPMAAWEEDFNRLFAGLPARRALGYRIWGDTMPFQGTINPNTVPVLQVESRIPMYLKGRSYDTYTPKGWMSQGTQLEGLNWKPSYSNSNSYLGLTEIDYVVHPSYSSKTLFASGRVSGASRDVNIETYDSPVYVLDVTPGTDYGGLPPLLALAGQNVTGLYADTGGRATDPAVAAELPAQFSLLEVRREDNIPRQVVLVEEIPGEPDVLSVRSSKGKVESGEGYRLTSQVSLAAPDSLRTAGNDYPTWALVKYTQLPASLPGRVRELAVSLTGQESNAYDKAKAIETYLRGMTYDLEIDPPPFGADGVDYFLFESRRGYSEYFGSAMAVLLRTLDIPARMISGYSVGDKVPDEDIYVVRDSHSHGWVEVFFPGFGWIPFEPTPGRELPSNYAPEALEPPVVVISGLDEELLQLCDEDIEECEDEDIPLDGTGLDGPANLNQGFRQVAPWLFGILGIGALFAVVGRLFWMKTMAPSHDPEVLFRKLGLLSRLNAVGPKTHETPFQFGSRLKEVVPELEGAFSVVIANYVRKKYGKKELSREQTDQLVDAWLSLRNPMLLRILRPRNLQRVAK